MKVDKKRDKDRFSCTNILMCSVTFNKPHYAAESTDVFCTVSCCSVTKEIFASVTQAYSSH